MGQGTPDSGILAGGEGKSRLFDRKVGCFMLVLLACSQLLGEYINLYNLIYIYINGL